MGERIRLRLDDGREVEATVETVDEAMRTRLTEEGTRLRLRPAAADDDVQGHGLTPSADVAVLAEDDTGGHAFTVRLPDTETARDVQRRLLGAGMVGVVVVGGGSTSMWVPDAGAAIAGVAAPTDGSRDRGTTGRGDAEGPAQG